MKHKVYVPGKCAFTMLAFAAITSVANANLAQSAPTSPDAVANAIQYKGMQRLGAFDLLSELTSQVGPRLAGSPGADKAVEWGVNTLKKLGFQNVKKVPCMVNHWVRGDKEQLTMISGNSKVALSVCALGNSIGTPSTGIKAEVIEVHSIAEAEKLGAKARGKIIFFNGPMDPAQVNTFAAYGRAVAQRGGGAVAAAKVGAIGAIVRSMTLKHDDVPHTGAMRYVDGVPKVPTAAISIVAAEKLSAAIKQNPKTQLHLKMNCKTLPPAPSANVIGEITGSVLPNEVVVVGGHLDSWDLGDGAHDDGAGIAQSIEAVSLIKRLGWKPKRTIRVVLFMNEENGGEGSQAYAKFAVTNGQKPYAAIESDSGGFAPRGFSTSLKGDDLKLIEPWLPALARFGIMGIESGRGTGADIAALERLGAKGFGLIPESQRYFDYHHSASDTIDKVNPRELQLGALSMSTLAWLLAESDSM